VGIFHWFLASGGTETEHGGLVLTADEPDGILSVQCLNLLRHGGSGAICCRSVADLLLRRSVAWLRRAGPFRLGRRVRFAGSDREFPRFAVRSGTQRARACFGEHLIRSTIPAVQTSPWLSDRPACTGRWRLPDPAPSGVVHVRCSAIPLARSAREWRRRPGRCHRAPCQPEADLGLISSARQPDQMSASLSALGTDRPPGCEPLSVVAKMW
jgi:hypothetical protein